MSEQINNYQDQISFKSLVVSLREWLSYLKSVKWKVLAISILGAVLGVLFAWIQPRNYAAKTTFVVEDAKSGGGLSGLASLAGQFGVDVGGSGAGGVIAGDNILLYFKSESLAREVLLSPFDSSKGISIADVYIMSHGLYKKWAKDKSIGPISFPIDSGNKVYSRLQDSLIKVIIGEYIMPKQFSIGKMDKKAGFIQLIITMRNEKLAKVYNDKLLKIGVDKYVELKTKRQKKTVDILQSRADSISSLLNIKTTATAQLQTVASTMDVNPLFKTSNIINTELNSRDKTMLAAVYGEVIKNLELAKFTLNQETPVIQIVDQDRLPLRIIKKSKTSNAIMFGLVFSFIALIYLIVKRAILIAMR